MITTQYVGRLGNRLFQYTIARLLAEKLGYALRTPYEWNDTITATPAPGGMIYPNDTVTIQETVETPALFDMRFEKRHYHLRGYWQCADYYVPFREKILGFFNEKATTVLDKENIVMHVRLTDYKIFGHNGTVLNSRYYLDCLEKETFKKLYIVTDQPEDEYFKDFKKFNPVFSSGTEKEDFWSLTKFSRIIIGNSTFSWWAAFLSNAEKVYAPSCWVRNSDDIPHRLHMIPNGIVVNAGFVNYPTPDLPPPPKVSPPLSAAKPVVDASIAKYERFDKSFIPDNPQFDIFLACAPKDFNKLPFVVRSIKKNVCGYSDMYVCSPTPVPDGIKAKIECPVKYVGDSDGLPMARREEWSYRPNWNFQQCLKMFQKFTRDWWVTIDCDTIINKPLEFFSNGRPIWWRGRDQCHENYFRFQLAIIGIGRVAPYSFIADMNLFFRPLVDEMLRKAGHTVKSFVRSSYDLIGPNCWIGEPELYGNFFYKHHPGIYLDRQLNQANFDGRVQNEPDITLWSDVEIQAKIDEMAKTDYHTFSLHSWLVEKGMP